MFSQFAQVPDVVGEFDPVGTPKVTSLHAKCFLLFTKQVSVRQSYNGWFTQTAGSGC